jgi:peptide/nickel transport system permease protein
LIGGAVVTETVYGWDGMGKLLIDAIRLGDRNVIMAWLLLAGISVVLFNLIADLLYAVLDPKIRYR